MNANRRQMLKVLRTHSAQSKSKIIHRTDCLFTGDRIWTARHPFYNNIFTSPPPGYKFSEETTFISESDAAHYEENILSKKWHLLPQSTRQFLEIFSDKCFKLAVTEAQFMQFLQGRPLKQQLNIPDHSKLLFVPTYPLYVGPKDWLIAIEDYTTLLYPHVQNGRTADLNIQNHFVTRIIAALCSLSNFKGFITHIRNTADTLAKLFPELEQQGKINYVPAGVRIPDRSRRKSVSDKKHFLFANSFHGGASHFFVRGGREVLAAFFAVQKRCPNLHLTIRNPLPWDHMSETEKDLVKTHPRIRHIEEHIDDSEMDDLMNQSDAFLIPSFRLHIVSTVKSLSHGLPVLCSDGWGFDEIVNHGQTGLVADGQWGVHSWTDEDGLLRENYDDGNNYKPRLGENLARNMLAVASDSKLVDFLSKNARKDAKKRFSSETRNEIFKNVLDGCMNN